MNGASRQLGDEGPEGRASGHWLVQPPPGAPPSLSEES